jgi:hypothetical protein
LGFLPDDEGWFSDETGWGFRIDCIPSFKVLLKRLCKSYYNDGYDDAECKKKRKYGMPLDR